MQKTLVRTVVLLLMAGLAGGCTPEAGSEAWCEAMSEKPKGDWTANQAADFARHCVLKLPDEDKS